MKKVRLYLNSAFEMPEEISKSVYVIIEQILFIISSFTISRAEILNGMSPFGMAFVAGIPTEFLIGTTLGSVAGYAVSSTEILPLRYIATVICIAAVRYCLRDIKNIRTNAAASCSLAFSASIVTGFATGFTKGLAAMTAVMYIAEAILASGGAFFFNRGLSITKRGLKNFRINEGQFACLTVSVCLILMSFSTITIAKLSPARIIAVLLVLFCAKIGGQAAGSIAGIAIGASMALVPQMSYLAAAYSVSGLISGIFAPAGQLGVAASFVATNAIVTLYMQNGDISTATLIEAGIASIIFVLIPSEYVKKIASFFSGEEKSENVSDMRKALCARLGLASKAMAEVSECVDKVSKGLLKMQGSNIAQVHTIVQERVCSGCSKRDFCWQKNFNDSMNVFNDIGIELKNSREITPDKLPTFFLQRCGMVNMLLSAFTSEYNRQIAKATASRSNIQVRGIVSEQFESVGDLLNDLSEEFKEIESFDDKAAFKVEEALRKRGIVPVSVNCILDKYDHIKIEIHCPKIIGGVDIRELTREIEAACDRELLQPNIMTIDKDNYIIFSERASYGLKVGHAQLISGGALNCGDCFDFFDDGRGRQILIISDGMGTGGRAAVDGAMASSLIGKLIKSGFSFDCALKVVNSALLLKSEEETFATLDIASFDLFTGKAEFLKAGAPPSFIKRKRTVKEIEASSLPAGILKQTHFEKRAANLSRGDILLLASDGVINGNSKWINTELSLWSGNDAQALAQLIAAKAHKRCGSEHTDDITVLVGIVQ